MRRKDVLNLIRVSVAKRGNVKEASCLYIENRISYAAYRAAVKEGYVAHKRICKDAACESIAHIKGAQ